MKPHTPEPLESFTEGEEPVSTNAMSKDRQVIVLF